MGDIESICCSGDGLIILIMVWLGKGGAEDDNEGGGAEVWCMDINDARKEEHAGGDGFCDWLLLDCRLGI